MQTSVRIFVGFCEKSGCGNEEINEEERGYDPCNDRNVPDRLFCRCVLLFLHRVFDYIDRVCHGGHQGEEDHTNADTLGDRIVERYDDDRQECI